LGVPVEAAGGDGAVLPLPAEGLSITQLAHSGPLFPHPACSVTEPAGPLALRRAHAASPMARQVLQHAFGSVLPAPETNLRAGAALSAAEVTAAREKREAYHALGGRPGQACPRRLRGLSTGPAHSSAGTRQRPPRPLCTSPPLNTASLLPIRRATSTGGGGNRSRDGRYDPPIRRALRALEQAFAPARLSPCHAREQPTAMRPPAGQGCNDRSSPTRSSLLFPITPAPAAWLGPFWAGVCRATAKLTPWRH